mmetsp:Transcript_30422/g.78886  ORF Transcript_30422/g.78886 Transcript_30422/m.78886 type:complete len:389 (+) Transcript_30422:455-1621(+)
MVKSQDQMAKSILRVAVVGAGSIGREFALRHFGAHTGTAVSAIVDRDIAAAERLAADAGAVAAGAKVIGGGYREAVSDRRGAPVPHGTALSDAILSTCDAVYVGTTPGSHRDLVLRALSQDKHVLLEKPLAATAEDADAIAAAVTAAEARGVHASMNIGMRYNQALIEMRRLVETGDVGELTSGKLGLHFAQWPREWQEVAWCAGRSEGGPLREVGTHFLFAINELFGHRCVTRVRADVRYPPADPKLAELAVHGTLELSSGLEIALSVTTDGSVSGAHGDLYELSVTGDGGTLVLDAFTALRRLGWRKRTVVRQGPYGRAECVHAFVEAVEHARTAGAGESDRRTAPVGSAQQCRWQPVSVLEGRNAQRVLDALLASGGEWVDVRYD